MKPVQNFDVEGLIIFKILRITGVAMMVVLLAAPLALASVTVNQNTNLQVQPNPNIKILPPTISFIRPSPNDTSWDSHNGGYKIEWKYSGGKDGKFMKDSLVRLDLYQADGTFLKVIVNNLPIGNDNVGPGTGSFVMSCPTSEIHGDYKFQIQSKLFPDVKVMSTAINIQYLPW